MIIGKYLIYIISIANTKVYVKDLTSIEKFYAMGNTLKTIHYFSLLNYHIIVSWKLSNLKNILNISSIQISLCCQHYHVRNGFMKLKLN